MPSITIDSFLSEVSKNYLGRGKSLGTVRQFGQVLRELHAVGVVDTCDLTDQAIIRWIAKWPRRTPVTFQSHLRALAVLCKRARKKGYLDCNPFDVDGVSEWIRADSRPSPAKRRYSKPAEQIRAMLRRADVEATSGTWEAQRLQAYVHTLFLTGARPGEIQRLRIVDFHRREMAIEICPHEITGRAGRRYWWKPKTEGSAGEIAIGDHLVNLLREWSARIQVGSHRGRLRILGCEWLFPGKKLLGPWTSGSAADRPLGQVTALGARAGVKGLTQKAARKGLGTYREIGLTPQGRREYFRHSDDATGDLYDERDIESRRGDAIRIEQFFTGT
jgi:integrase